MLDAGSKDEDQDSDGGSQVGTAQGEVIDREFVSLKDG